MLHDVASNYGHRRGRLNDCIAMVGGHEERRLSQNGARRRSLENHSRAVAFAAQQEDVPTLNKVHIPNRVVAMKKVLPFRELQDRLPQ